MVGEFDPINKTYSMYNRYGESIGIFILREGGWEFVIDQYREPILSQHEMVILDRMQMELNT